MSKERHEEYKEHREHEKQKPHGKSHTVPEESKQELKIHKIVIAVAIIVVIVFAFMSLIGVMP